MKYKVGDTVKLVSKRSKTWNFGGQMDNFLGSIQKIKEISDWAVRFENPDTHRWSFDINDIDCLVPSSYPKVMWVRDTDKQIWRKRVVFMEKAGRFLAWTHATTLEEAENTCEITTWIQAKDFAVVELTIEEIAEKFDMDPEQIRIKE